LIDATEFGLAGVLYEAGMPAPAGRYQRIDGAARVVVLEQPGRLPPSFDGRVALYARITERVGVEARG
jgi:hypothetical protein